MRGFIEELRHRLWVYSGYILNTLSGANGEGPGSTLCENRVTQCCTVVLSNADSFGRWELAGIMPPIEHPYIER